jgi:hypothetical protein
MCPVKPPILVTATISETSAVRCALNTIKVSIKADSSMPVGSFVIVDGLNAHM